MQNIIIIHFQKGYRRFLLIISQLFSFLRVLKLNCLPFIKVKFGCYVEANVKVSTFYGGSVRIGNKCLLRNGSRILSYGGNIIIGNNCSINPFSILYGQGNLIIGNNVRIAAHCILIPSNHNFSDPDIPITFQGSSCKGITIEDDVWIGCGVRVLDGVKIGKGCVIGAGSVITKSTIPYGIYVGCPAKLVKTRK